MKSKELEEALLTLQGYIRSDEYKENVKRKIGIENLKFEMIEKSYSISEEQLRNKFDM